MIDTHCHIHDPAYNYDLKAILGRADQAGVEQFICVGTDPLTSAAALALATKTASCYASAALHPHQAVATLPELETAWRAIRRLVTTADTEKLVAIGECGLDYHYHHDQATKDRQQTMLRWHLELAQSQQLPVIFHVRSAWADFWPIYEEFNLSGVIHSFSADQTALDQILSHSRLLVGVNGLVTFAKEDQLAALANIPPERLVLETDAPFLTPVPFRGKVNEPSYLEYVVDSLAELRSEDRSALKAQTTSNARRLFKLPKR